jgi:hypothetical protein
LGDVRARLGRYQQAEANFRSAITSYEAIDPDHAYFIPCLEAFAGMLERLGRRDEADTARRRAAAIRLKTGGS